ncbi:MAG TPA: hypothetical protein VLX29_07650 [Nitrospirota bacterium]|nr:hypothetical protein [Nitrospirota bacterium]
MSSQKLPDRITLMPTCPVNIQPDRIAAKSVIQVSQYCEEAFPVSTLCLDDSSTAKKRSNPARNIQSFLVLAGCRNFQPFPNERPAAAKSGM